MMSNKTYGSPQVGPGDSGESHPSSEGCPIGYGGDNYSSKRPDKLQEIGMVRTPSGSSDLAGIEDPFKRRDSLSRTPPSQRKFAAKGMERPRSDSCSNIQLEMVGGRDDNPAKRKRGDGPSSPTGYTKEAKKFFENIGKLCKYAQDLVKEVNNSYNPKKEFKKLATNLAYLSEELESSKYVVIPFGERKPAMADIGVQANIPLSQRAEADRELEVIESVLNEGDTLEDLDEVIDLAWPETAYKTVTEEVGCPWSVGKEWDLVTVIDTQEGADKGFTKTIIDRIPDFMDLVEAGLAEGRLDYLEKSTRVGSGNTAGVCHTSLIFALPVNMATGEGNKDWRETFCKMATELRKETREKGRSKLAFVSSDNVDRRCLRKLLEYVFRGADINIKLVLPKKASTKSTRNRQSRKQLDSVIVKAEGRTYVELLKTVKEKVDVERLGVSVRTLRRTNAGNVLLRVEGGRKEANTLREEIKSKVLGAEVTIRSNDKVLHVADIDAATTREEVQTTLDSLPECTPPGSVYVKSLRPTRDGNQIATVLAPAELADALLKRRRITIGWSRCRLRERVDVLRCYRCLEFGHLTNSCKGQDRSADCINCGVKGHKAKDCKNLPKCIHCDGAPHRSDSTKCPKFRQVLEERTKSGQRSKSDHEC